MKPAYEDILDALEGMALQYLSDVDGNIMTHDFMIAGENCLDVLQRLGKVKSDDGVSYTFVDDEKGDVGI